MEQTGQKRTKYYKDNPEAMHKRNKRRMWVNGHYISKSHPLHKAGRYRSFEDAAFSSLVGYKTNPEGAVYAVVNEAWPEWIKVGKAVDAEDRLKSYQTGSPYRNYKLIHSVKVDNRNEKEVEAHNKLAEQYEQRNEWFKCSEAEVKEILKELT